MGLPRETIEIERAYTVVQSASAGLLNRLFEHHDFNVTRPENWRDWKVEIPPPPLSPRRTPFFSIVSEEPLPPSIEDIKRAACQYFKLPMAILMSDRRQWLQVYARQIVMYLAYHNTHKSFPKIGRALGGRDHTTVMHGVRKIEKDLKDVTVAYDVAHVEALVS